MNLSLTLLDGRRGAFEVLPNCEVSSGAITVTARPSRHERALTQALLAGFGVDDRLSGAGRSEAKDWLNLRARVAAYETKVVVVRHADLLSEPMLTKLLAFARDLGIDLCLSCDEAAGAGLGAWVSDNDGSCHEESAWLDDRLRGHRRQQPPETAPPFPQHLPAADFYMFRARCRELLDPDSFKTVDALYLQIARSVAAAPFHDAESAADWIREQHDVYRSPAELKTVIRAAQAAMFTHGVLMKCNLTQLLTNAYDGTFRRLDAEQIRSLARYRQTYRAAMLVLRDAGLSIEEMAGIKVEDVLPNLDLATEAQRYLACHRNYRRLEGASEADLLFTSTGPGMAQVFRVAAIELGLPMMATKERRSGNLNINWRSGAGICFLSLERKVGK